MAGSSPATTITVEADGSFCVRYRGVSNRHSRSEAVAGLTRPGNPAPSAHPHRDCFPRLSLGVAMTAGSALPVRAMTLWRPVAAGGRVGAGRTISSRCLLGIRRVAQGEECNGARSPGMRAGRGSRRHGAINHAAAASCRRWSSARIMGLVPLTRASTISGSGGPKSRRTGRPPCARMRAARSG